MLSQSSKIFLLFLYYKTPLPFDLIKIIIDIYEEDGKRFRREYNYQRFGRGTLKAAVKRRANQIGHCIKCGALKHYTKCKLLPTISQSECASALREDTVRLKAESVLRPNNNASQMVDDLIDIRNSKLRIRP